MAEYIERGTAIAKLNALEVIEPLSTMTDAKQFLADMPAADVAPVVHARWVGDGLKGNWCYCSNCEKAASFFMTSDYCPNCGAKMDGGETNDGA